MYMVILFCFTIYGNNRVLFFFTSIINIFYFLGFKPGEKCLSSRSFKVNVIIISLVVKKFKVLIKFCLLYVVDKKLYWYFK
jgi:hypothetical protein